jgi:hypothetical protein
MAYLVIAYPDLSDEDFAMIQAYRKVNDSFYYSIVEPHFTFVFPVFDQALEMFTREVKEHVKDVPRIHFTIRCATVNKDAFSDNFYTFLVPDDGYSGIVKLHDKLYSGLLANNLRLDIDFIPHMGIGTSKDKYECQRMAGEWNEKDFSIGGTITHLTVVEYKDQTVTNLENIELK